MTGAYPAIYGLTDPTDERQIVRTTRAQSNSNLQQRCGTERRDDSQCSAQDLPNSGRCGVCVEAGVILTGRSANDAATGESDEVVVTGRLDDRPGSGWRRLASRDGINCPRCEAIGTLIPASASRGAVHAPAAITTEAGACRDPSGNVTSRRSALRTSVHWPGIARAPRSIAAVRRAERNSRPLIRAPPV